jgi:hypothetical protein
MQPPCTQTPKLPQTLANTCTFCHTDCLREVQATVDQKKPLCIVIDPVRGGAPLHEIEAECDAHFQHAIFGGGARPKRDIITWHRIKDFQLVSIKLLAEQLQIGCLRERSLLGGPDSSMVLYVPGELQRQRLVLSRRLVVYASPHNPGALAVAKDIASAMSGQIKVTSDPEMMTVATHLLLYLNDQTYLHAAGVKLSEELRRARAAGSTIEVLMVHENDAERGGCEFRIFFDGRTPSDLKQNGIYDVKDPFTALCPSPSRLSAAYSPTRPISPRAQALALALYSEQFWPVSAALVAKAMGATAARWCSGGRSRRSFTTASALRTSAVGAAAVLHIKGAVGEVCHEGPLSDSVPTNSAQDNQEQQIDALLASLSKSSQASEEEVQSCRLRLLSLISGGASSNATATPEVSISYETGEPATVSILYDSERLSSLEA